MQWDAHPSKEGRPKRPTNQEVTKDSYRSLQNAAQQECHYSFDLRDRSVTPNVGKTVGTTGLANHIALCEK
jgi:hypothetical protein